MIDFQPTGIKYQTRCGTQALDCRGSVRGWSLRSKFGISTVCLFRGISL